MFLSWWSFWYFFWKIIGESTHWVDIYVTSKFDIRRHILTLCVKFDSWSNFLSHRVTECASYLLSTTARSTTSALTIRQVFFSEIAAKSDIPDCADLDGEGNGQGSTPLWGPVWRHRAPGSWCGDQFLVLGPHGAPKIWQTQIWQFSSKFEIRSHILTLGVKFDSGSNFWGIQVTYMQPHGFSLVTMVFKCIMME